MKVAVIMVWRPKNFPEWNGRSRASGQKIPSSLEYDRGAAPYTAVHLASLLPRRWTITVVHEMVRDVDVCMDVDAVFLSTLDFCAPHALFLARQFRSRGVKVIVGGLYPTLNPAYFRGLVDAVVVGEAEPVMNKLVMDLENHQLEAEYRAPAAADITDLPVPRYQLVETAFKVPMSYEATRGCPFTCSFCVLSAIRLPYRRRPLANVIRDIRAVPGDWNWLQRKYLIFWDNNLGADRKYFRELCEALAPLRRIWGTETSIDTITPESARAMGKSGCRFLYIGLESLAQDSLRLANKNHNKVSEFKKRLKYLHDNGILVMSIFLLGLDSDTPEYIQDLPDLVHEIGVDVPVFSFAAPIEGTAFYRQLQQAGRILPGNILGGMDGAHLTYLPRHIPADELELALFQCMQRAYRLPRIMHRVVRGWRCGVWSGFANTGANLFYAPYQRALATAGLRRVKQRGPWPGVPADGPVCELPPPENMSALAGD